MNKKFYLLFLAFSTVTFSTATMSLPNLKKLTGQGELTKVYSAIERYDYEELSEALDSLKAYYKSEPLLHLMPVELLEKFDDVWQLCVVAEDIYDYLLIYLSGKSSYQTRFTRLCANFVSKYFENAKLKSALEDYGQNSSPETLRTIISYILLEDPSGATQSVFTLLKRTPLSLFFKYEATKSLVDTNKDLICFLFLVKEMNKTKNLFIESKPNLVIELIKQVNAAQELIDIKIEGERINQDPAKIKTIQFLTTKPGLNKIKDLKTEETGSILKYIDQAIQSINIDKLQERIAPEIIGIPEVHFISEEDLFYEEKAMEDWKKETIIEVLKTNIEKDHLSFKKELFQIIETIKLFFQGDEFKISEMISALKIAFNEFEKDKLQETAGANLKNLKAREQQVCEKINYHLNMLRTVPIDSFEDEKTKARLKEKLNREYILEADLKRYTFFDESPELKLQLQAKFIDANDLFAKTQKSLLDFLHKADKSCQKNQPNFDDSLAQDNPLNALAKELYKIRNTKSQDKTKAFYILIMSSVALENLEQRLAEKIILTKMKKEEAKKAKELTLIDLLKIRKRYLPAKADPKVKDPLCGILEAAFIDDSNTDYNKKKKLDDDEKNILRKILADGYQNTMREIVIKKRDFLSEESINSRDWFALRALLPDEECSKEPSFNTIFQDIIILMFIKFGKGLPISEEFSKKKNKFNNLLDTLRRKRDISGDDKNTINAMHLLSIIFMYKLFDITSEPLEKIIDENLDTVINLYKPKEVEHTNTGTKVNEYAQHIQYPKPPSPKKVILSLIIIASVLICIYFFGGLLINLALNWLNIISPVFWSIVSMLESILY